MIVKTSNELSRLHIFLPKSLSKEFWLKCIFSDIKAIGLKSERWINLENGVLSFPFD